jgi:hypothetical protein
MTTKEQQIWSVSINQDYTFGVYNGSLLATLTSVTVTVFITLMVSV